MRIFKFSSLCSLAFTFTFSNGSMNMLAQEFDLTKDAKSFSVEKMPVILRSTPDEASISNEIVAFQISTFGGVTLSEKAGTLDLLSLILPRGTYSYSKEQIDEILTQTGASFSIQAGNDSLNVSLKCLKRFLPQLLPVVSEIIRLPKLDTAEIQLSKDQLLAQLKNEQDHPDSLLALRMHQTFYQGHPYYVRPSGYLDSLPKVTRDDLASAQHRAFNKNNVLFVIVGNLTQAEVSSLLKKHFGSLPDGSRAQEVRDTPNNITNKIHYFPINAPTTYFMARFKAPALEHPDYPALTVAMQILDNRLFEEVRTKRALTYAVSASVGNSRINHGSLYVSSTDLAKAVEVIFEEIKKLQVAEISPEEISDQVNKFLSSWYLSRETRSSQALILSLYEVFGIGWENSNSFINRLHKVTPEKIREVMVRYLKEISMVIVGPKAIEGLEPKLSRLGFVDIKTTTPTDIQTEKKLEPQDQTLDSKELNPGTSAK